MGLQIAGAGAVPVAASSTPTLQLLVPTVRSPHQARAASSMVQIKHPRRRLSKILWWKSGRQQGRPSTYGRVIVGCRYALPSFPPSPPPVTHPFFPFLPYTQSPDGCKGHEPQYWFPLTFDNEGVIGRVTWVDLFVLDLEDPMGDAAWGLPVSMSRR